jgi:hypothetical protein
MKTLFSRIVGLIVLFVFALHASAFSFKGYLDELPEEYWVGFTVNKKYVFCPWFCLLYVPSSFMSILFSATGHQYIY